MSSSRGVMFFFLDADRVKGVWRWVAWALCALVGITFSIEGAPVAAAAPVKPAFGEPKKPSKVSSRPDETSAAVSARAQGSPVEVESLRTETSSTFANPDGTMTTKATAAPTRFKDDKGAWKNLDLTLTQQPDGTIAPKSVKNDLTLGAGDASASGGAATVAPSLGVDALEVKPDVNTSVVFGWPKKLPKPKLQGNEATYANADSGVDYRVQALRTGSETFVDVKDAKSVKRLIAKNGPAKGRLAIDFPVTLDGLAVKKESDGSVSFLDSKNKVVSHLAAPAAWDATMNEKAGIPANTTETRIDVTTRARTRPSSPSRSMRGGRRAVSVSSRSRSTRRTPRARRRPASIRMSSRMFRTPITPRPANCVRARTTVAVSWRART